MVFGLDTSSSVLLIFHTPMHTRPVFWESCGRISNILCSWWCNGHLHIMAYQLVWHHHELLSWARAHNICAMLMHILPLVEMYCNWKLRDNGGNLRVFNKVFFFLVLRVDFKACLDILFLIHMRTHSWDKRDVSCNWWGLWTHLQIHVNITSTVNNGWLHTHSL